MDSQDEITQLHEAAAIVVFAKCPIPGSSKTRLAGLLGEHGSAMMAEAMLSDVILSLSHDVSFAMQLLSDILFVHQSISTSYV
mmetsp:Transcript_22186/g.33796  ORF Transcript_22186/g.33796 Transcript_22186/m.33796 type:complete len:83 (-) Transcript_22186:1071-1319(-)